MSSRSVLFLVAAIVLYIIGEAISIHERRDAQIEAALKTCLGRPDAGKPLPMKAAP